MKRIIPLLLPILILSACVAAQEGQDTPQQRVAEGIHRSGDYVANTPVPNPSNPLEVIMYGIGAIGALTGTGVATAKAVNRQRDGRRVRRHEPVEVPDEEKA